VDVSIFSGLQETQPGKNRDLEKQDRRCCKSTISGLFNLAIVPDCAFAIRNNGEKPESQDEGACVNSAPCLRRSSARNGRRCGVRLLMSPDFAKLQLRNFTNSGDPEKQSRLGGCGEIE